MAIPEDVVTWAYDVTKASEPIPEFADVAKLVWQAHEEQLRASGSLFYTWQTVLQRVMPSLIAATSAEKRLLDAFISHSSKDAAAARQIEKGLEVEGLEVWLDTTDIRLGGLLRAELQENIRKSRSLILLWSAWSSVSRWVATEWLMAFHEDKFILPCVLDDTSILEWLGDPIWLDLRGRPLDPGDPTIAQISRNIREAPDRSNDVVTFPRRRGADYATLKTIHEGQEIVLGHLNRGSAEAAAREQRILDPMIEKARRRWPKDPVVMCHAGYHKKNEYIIRHADSIGVGRPPRDPLLEEAEELFLTALSVDPRDMSAINGLGSILIYKRELDAAEFFVRRAIRYAKGAGLEYTAAEHDFELIMGMKKQIVREVP